MNVVGRKYYLVPSESYDHENKQQVLSNIKRPVEQALYQSVQNMSHIMKDKSLPPDIRVQKHSEEMDKMDMFIDKIKQPTQIPPPPPPPVPANDTTLHDLVMFNTLPSGAKPKAQFLLNELTKHDIAVKPSGEVMHKNDTWHGSHIRDLVSSVVRNQPSVEHPEYHDKFMNILAEMNFPQDYIANVKSREKYSKIKKDESLRRRRIYSSSSPRTSSISSRFDQLLKHDA